ncbi:hypothetical protein GF378_01050 [Candidatus Pacearchaeota archaeon]|nr:hypothetical protein [Candidatus Pacearchaeota archaeon]
MNINIEVKKRHLVFILALFLISGIYATVGHGLSQIIADSDFSMNDNKITYLENPTNDKDAATKEYVDEHDYLQINTYTYSSCIRTDRLCDLPVKVSANGHNISKPSWATKMHLRCVYGCHYYDKTSTWKLFLGDEEIYTKSGRCNALEKYPPVAPYFLKESGDYVLEYELAAYSGDSVLDMEFDISNVPTGSVLKGQAASDRTNYLGHCTVTFYS